MVPILPGERFVICSSVPKNPVSAYHTSIRREFSAGILRTRDFLPV